MATTNETAIHDAALAALKALEPVVSEMPSDLLEGLASLTGTSDTGEEETSTEKMAKAMADLNEAEGRISKSEDRERLRQAVRKAREAVELEYLAQMSPASAQRFERGY